MEEHIVDYGVDNPYQVQIFWPQSNYDSKIFHSKSWGTLANLKSNLDENVNNPINSRKNTEVVTPLFYTETYLQIDHVVHTSFLSFECLSLLP